MRTNEEKKFKETCYETYRTLWLLKHGFTLNELMRRLTEHAVEELREMPIEDQSNETDVRAFMDSLADCLWTDGFEAGCFYENEKEFYDREFLDPAYMEQLFSFMPGDKDELLASWYEISGVTPPEKEEETLEVKTPAGMIRAYENTDPGKPGITIRLLPNGYQHEIEVTDVFVPEAPQYQVFGKSPDVVVYHVDFGTLLDKKMYGSFNRRITREHLFQGAVWSIKGVGFMDIGSKESGWQYRLYDYPDCREICSGRFDDPDADPITVRDSLIERYGWHGEVRSLGKEEQDWVESQIGRQKLRSLGWSDEALEALDDYEVRRAIEEMEEEK